MQIQVPTPPRKHVKNRVEKDRRNNDPPENHTELDLPGEELEKAKREVEKDRSGEIRVPVNGLIDSERVENRSGLAPDLFRVDPELVEERLLVFEGG